jgi:dolichol-phosphate mannosyltransferase
MLIVVITFMSGVQLLFLGVIGEYLGRVYEEVKRRPQYFVDQVIRASKPPAAHGS